MPKCFMCGSADIEELTRVPAAKIARRYRDTFNIDVQRLFSDKEIRLLKCKTCDLRFYFPLDAGDGVVEPMQVKRLLDRSGVINPEVIGNCLV